MADEIYVSAGALSSDLLKKVKSNLKSAKDKMDRLDSGAAMQKASYQSPLGILPIFDAEMIASAVRIDLEIEKLEAIVAQYAAILDSGPDALEEIDKSYKSKKPSWWERMTYSAARFISRIFSSGNKTGADISIGSDGDWSSFVSEEKLAIINQYDAEWVEQHREGIEKLARSYMGIAGFTAAMDALYTDTTKSDYDIYREKVEKINTLVPVGEIQHYQDNTGTYEYKPYEGIVGQCPWVATTTLIQRKRAYEGKNTSVTCEEVLANGGGFNKDGSYKVGGITYQLQSVTGPYTKEKIMELLNEHPEGIGIYGSGHAIVITDYVDDDGEIIFYADDGVNDNPSVWKNEDRGRITLDKTSFVKSNGGSLENLTYVFFISSES